MQITSVEALARGIIEELRAAGLEIRRTDAIPIRNPGVTGVRSSAALWGSMMPVAPPCWSLCRAA
jgi:hypothetical protein